MPLWIAEITAYDPGTAGVITWRFASHGYDNAGTFYPPRIENPATVTRSMSGVEGGRISTAFSELTLLNLDDGLNDLADDYFDGRTLTLKLGYLGAAYSEFRTILVAVIETVAVERERLSVRLRDRTYQLDKPFSTAKYAGNNVLPNGIEGLDDLKDKYKPLVFGRVALMQPVLVNTSKLIYQVSAGNIEAVVNVFDAGAYLTRSDNYVSQADMEANAPLNGTYRVWPAGGCFRIGSSPFGEISCSVVELWDYLQISAAGIIRRILQSAGYTSADWVEGDFAALNQRNAGSLGVMVNEGEATASLLDRICQTVGAWWGFDALNRFRVVRFDAPSGTPIWTFTNEDIIDIERQPDSRMPVWSTLMRSDLNYATQDQKSLAGVVTLDRAGWLSLESRDQKTELPAVHATRLLAEAVTYDSLFNAVSVAKAEATRRANLYSVRRDTVTLTAGLPAASVFASIDLGAVVSVQTTRLGYGSGKLFTVIGIQADFQRNTCSLTLWG